jgi:hypothetical protein
VPEGGFALIDVRLVAAADAPFGWSAVQQFGEGVLLNASRRGENLVCGNVLDHSDLNNLICFFTMPDSPAELAQITHALRARFSGPDSVG